MKSNYILSCDLYNDLGEFVKSETAYGMHPDSIKILVQSQNPGLLMRSIKITDNRDFSSWKK